MKTLLRERKMIFVFLCLAVSLFACRTEPNRTASGMAGDIQFHREEISVPLWDQEDFAAMAPEGAEPPALRITLSLAEVSGKSGGKDEALKALFQDLFFQGMDARDYAREQIRDKTFQYRSVREAVRDQPDRVFSETLNWYYEEKLDVEMNGSRFLVVSRSWAEYTGGAHGNYGKNYFVFDREKAGRISLPDLMKEGFGRVLTEKLDQELRKNRELDRNDSLRHHGFFVNQVEPTENFFLSSKGIGFHWDPYEIGPYAMGFVEIVVPYGEIGDILSSLGRSAAREAGIE
ncbi:MAG: DUF3298 and DUF4163 domain-containing protein [Treponema sp.]|jgi:hypothetical protein|nr:DUF3298 and DUF4163 domain-containing protein [Treponema sp.]